MVDILGFENAGRRTANILPGDDPVNDRRGPGGLARNAFRLIFGNRKDPESGLVGRLTSTLMTPQGLIAANLLSGQGFGESVSAGVNLQRQLEQDRISAERNAALDEQNAQAAEALAADRAARLAQQQQNQLIQQELARQNLITRQQGQASQQQIARQGLEIRQQAQDIQERAEARQQEKAQIKEQERQSRARNALVGLDSRNQLVLEKIDEAIGLATPGNTGVTGQLMQNIGGTEARKLKGVLRTIKSNIGFGELQRLRDASPTGGAVGQLSDPERQALESTLGDLDQALDNEDLIEVLQRLKQEITTGRQARRDAFLTDFGFDPFAEAEADAPEDENSLENLSDDEIDRRIEELQRGG